MKITVYGNNPSALVTAACLADIGNEVLLVSSTFPFAEKIEESSISEPGLKKLLGQQLDSGRLRLSQSLNEGAEYGGLHFLLLDPEQLELAETIAGRIGMVIESDTLLVNRTTFPIGTSDRLYEIVQDELNQRGAPSHCHLIVEPDFMTEGRMIQNFRRPDRILLGSDSVEGVEIMRDLYAPYNRNRDVVMTMSPRSAELTKFASNAMLATRISFMNEMADVAEDVGADIEEVRQGMGSDQRIGYDYLYPGTGFGGPNFAKDVATLANTIREAGSAGQLLDAVLEINEQQKEVLFRKAWSHFEMDLRGKRFALWGISYKPGSCDIRNAPGVELVETLVGQGASVQIYDPEAMESAKRYFGEQSAISYGEGRDSVLDGADGLMIVTEWKSFWSPDFNLLIEKMKTPVVFDGRNLYSPEKMRSAGIKYYGVGRGEK
ncbi:MAG: UDP-glucose/GDP-mannose dehydrogenase family protein [Gammaproteobacteria bacterium]|uniref:UDP-glucose 6-dehydrogenase n=1 Tax=Candidatus Thiopontia autotrophica TaxID=2841688 RepID=A0A8J6PFA4_9GAMM|nr:UDP-glucose/GDP-mannose dehydrogenase family protein [Candidatus Thiopontia autotrophica]MBL6985164.1 UDP-glucose/GDP-mannose dehydrogenase family protein [Candidatus Thioglobus sp.]